MPSTEINNLIGEIKDLIIQFKSYEETANNILISSNDLINVISENTKLGESSGTRSGTTSVEKTESETADIFSKSIDIFSTSVTAFQSAVQTFVNGIATKPVQQGTSTQQTTNVQQPTNSGGNTDWGNVLGGVAAAGVGIWGVSKILGMFGGSGGGSGGGKGGKGIIGEFLGAIPNQFKELDKGVAGLRAQFHFTNEAAQGIGISINEAAVATELWGIKAKDLAKLMGDLSTKTGITNMLSRSDMFTFGALETATKNQGVAFADFAHQLGIGVSGTENMFNEMNRSASNFGVDAVKHTQNMLGNMKVMNNFHFRNGVKGFADMAAHAMRMRLDMTAVSNYADKYRSLESAFETSAQIQVLGGSYSQHADPLKNMYNSIFNPEEFQKDMVSVVGKSMSFDRKKGMVTFDSGEDMLRAQAYAEASGRNFDEMVESGRRFASERYIVEELKGSGLSSDLQDLVKGKANFGKDDSGREGWVMSVLDKTRGEWVNKNVKDLTPEDLKSAQTTSERSLFEIATNTKTLTEIGDGIKQGVMRWSVNQLFKALPGGLYGTVRGGYEWAGGATQGLSGKNLTQGVGHLVEKGGEAFEGIKNTALEGWGYIRDNVVPYIKGIIGSATTWFKGDGWQNFQKEIGKVWREDIAPIFASIGKWFSDNVWTPFYDNWLKPKIDDFISWFKITFYKLIGNLPFFNKNKWYGKAADEEIVRAERSRDLANVAREKGNITGAERHDRKYESRIERAEETRSKGGGFDWTNVGATTAAGALGGGIVGSVIPGVGTGVVAAIGGAGGFLYGVGKELYYMNRQPTGNQTPTTTTPDITNMYDGMISSHGKITKFDSQDQILAAKPDGAISQFLNNSGMSSRSNNNIGGSKFSHSGNISINLSGNIQLQDPNGGIHNWDKLTRDPQFISNLTDKITMEITKKMNYSSSGDGRMVYGNYSRGMFS